MTPEEREAREIAALAYEEAARHCLRTGGGMRYTVNAAHDWEGWPSVRGELGHDWEAVTGLRWDTDASGCLSCYAAPYTDLGRQQRAAALRKMARFIRRGR